MTCRLFFSLLSALAAAPAWSQENAQVSRTAFSLNFQNIEVRAALHALAEFAGQNILISDSVTGQMNLRLDNVEWEHALDLILQARGLEQQKRGEVIHIGRREEWLANDKQRFDAGKERHAMQPLNVTTFALRHRQATDIKKLMEDGHVLSERGSLLADAGTNTLQVNDTAATANRISDFLQHADVPQRQVLIEARIVEASDNFSRNLGIKLNFARIRDQERAGSAKQAGDIISGIDQPASAPFGAIAALFKASARTLIGLELQAMQAEDQGRIISSPRLLAADQAEATIEEGSEIPYSHTTTRGATSTAFKKATLSLKVKPRIMQDNRSVWIDIEISKDSPNFRQHVGGAPTVDTKRIHTHVHIENGGTVVLGGIYIDEQSQVINKVPLLGDAPLIGFLFNSKHTRHNRRELLVFITPRIISGP